MLNYLSAELWRMTRRRGDLLAWGVFLLLVLLVGLTYRGSTPWAVLMGFENFMVMGLYLAFPLAEWAGGGSERSGGLVNEVAFGLPRARIYLGKLFAALLVGTALFLLTAFVFFMGALSTGTVLAQSGEEWAMVSAGLLLAMLRSLPRYVGAVSLACFLVFTLRPAGVGAVLYYLYITLGELVLSVSSFYGLGPVGELVNRFMALVRPFLLSSTYYGLGNVPSTLCNSWLTGALWLVLTTGLGLILFRRKEIR